VRTEAPEASLGKAADLIEQALSELGAHPGRSYLEAVRDGSYQYDPVVFADRSALIGLSNPFAPPMTLSREGDVAVGTLRFGPAYEGAPGWVHGGMVAAVIDQVFGFLQVTRGIPSVTGKLSVSYRKPTPLETPLRIEARPGEERGRTSILTARLLDGEVLLAEAEAVFVRIDAEAIWAQKQTGGP
jgi:acyl-coenzyme A thioesterase PaaI-like protein